MKLYQKLKEVVTASTDMNVVDKAYVCTALDDIAAYATSKKYSGFVDEGAVPMLAAVNGLSTFDCSETMQAHCSKTKQAYLDEEFVKENLDVISTIFERWGLITDTLVNDFTLWMCSERSSDLFWSGIDYPSLANINVGCMDVMSYVSQEAIWRHFNKHVQKIDENEEIKLLDMDKEYFMNMFCGALDVAFIRSIIHKMSDAQLKDVYEY